MSNYLGSPPYSDGPDIQIQKQVQQARVSESLSRKRKGDRCRQAFWGFKAVTYLILCTSILLNARQFRTDLYSNIQWSKTWWVTLVWRLYAMIIALIIILLEAEVKAVKAKFRLLHRNLVMKFLVYSLTGIMTSSDTKPLEELTVENMVCWLLHALGFFHLVIRCCFSQMVDDALRAYRRRMQHRNGKRSRNRRKSRRRLRQMGGETDSLDTSDSESVGSNMSTISALSDVSSYDSRRGSQQGGGGGAANQRDADVLESYHMVTRPHGAIGQDADFDMVPHE
mmetsp:Transcript_60173/g.82490  ORF Transcript_60173/g.82490 Transcript_60173/m.82490 type:complete len:282 (-) Transcript_60173:325-1170(-)